MAIEAFTHRDPAKVEIPGEPVPIATGFSNEAILESLRRLARCAFKALKAGRIRGVVGIVGCNNPKLKHDHVHVHLAKELIKRDILVVVVLGCATVAMGKAGLMMPAAREMAGSGLAEVCEALGIPPVLHVGSCVDNSRILHLCSVLANHAGVDSSDLPVAASAPEWYSEKGCGHRPLCRSQRHLHASRSAAEHPWQRHDHGSGPAWSEDVYGATFGVEPDPFKAADMIDARIKTKRLALAGVTAITANSIRDAGLKNVIAQPRRLHSKQPPLGGFMKIAFAGKGGGQDHTLRVAWSDLVRVMTSCSWTPIRP